MNPSIIKAGFFPRLCAFLVDMIIVSVILLIIKVPVGIIGLLMPDAFIFKGFLFDYNIFDITYYIVQLAYFVLMTTLAGTTLGKAIFKLSVVDEEGNKLKFFDALYRESIGKFLSSLCFLGYLMIFIDKNKRALHDYLCDSYVIYSIKMRVVEKKVQETPEYEGSRIPKNSEIAQSSNEENEMYASTSGYYFTEEGSEQVKEADKDDIIEQILTE